MTGTPGGWAPDGTPGGRGPDGRPGTPPGQDAEQRHPTATPASTGDLPRLAELAAGLAGAGRRAILGVAGSPGAGKTTFVAALIAEVARIKGADWVAHLPMDGFHLADAQLRRLGVLSRKGGPDTFDGVGYAHTLHRVRRHPQEWIYIPGFERTLEQPLAAALVVPPTARLVVTEGNYLLLSTDPWPRVRAELDQVWFLSTDDQLRIDRLLQRHARFGKSPAQAATFVSDSDERNALLVAATSFGADLQVRNSELGWLIA